MAKYTDLLGYTTGTGTSFAAMTGSPYAPKTAGRLTKIKILVERAANTSILFGGEIQLKCPSFGGVDHQVPFAGKGEHAADLVDAGIGVQEHDCDLAVKIGSQITVNYRFLVTPTTPHLYVYGDFEG